MPHGAAVVAGLNELTPAEGSVTLAAGVFFILCGQANLVGGVTLQTRTTQGLRMFTSDVPLTVHVPVYTTAILAAVAPPVTFDPRPVPTGAAVASIANVVPIIRLRGA